MLRAVDPDSTVLFLEAYADVSESDEVKEFVVPRNEWMHEVVSHSGATYEVWHPWPNEPGDHPEGAEVKQSLQRVVVLANGPTNLRFEPNA